MRTTGLWPGPGMPLITESARRTIAVLLIFRFQLISKLCPTGGREIAKLCRRSGSITLELPSQSMLRLRSLMLVVLASVLANLALAQDTVLTFDQAQTAGISGFRAHWNQPIPLSEG